MSAAANPTSSNRARRGRVLIVGPTPELEHALPPDGLYPQLVRVRSIFEAMGELMAAPAATPIATVVLPEHVVPTTSHGVVEAMRKIDPSIRIIAIVQRERWDTTARAAWVAAADQCVETPITPIDLRLIFHDDDALEPANDPIRAAEPDSNLTRAEPHTPVARMDQRRPATDPAAPSQPQPTMSTTATAPTAPSNVPPTQPAAEPRVEPALRKTLGDTDLVEAILTKPSALTDVALQLITQETGWRDVQLSGSKPAATSSAAAVAVTFLGNDFGMLCASDATAPELQPWAEWLARWLTLDRTHQQHRQRCMEDDLTGAGNRRCFDSFLQDAINRAAKNRRPVTLMVFDIDNFKSYNDQYGHEAGDEILRETVRLMQSVIRHGDRVCRIGGDEFAVIFADEEAPREPGSKHPESVESIAKRFQDQICKMKFPKLAAEAPGTLTISAGLATYPWDGSDPATLLRHADHLALESKRRGKNIITFGQGARNICQHQQPK